MKEFEKALKRILNETKTSTLKEATTYALMGGGKRIRPLLGVKVLEAYGVDPEPYIDVVLSVEMIHTYSLIHDDLPAMDDDDLRRGRPTVHKAFDEATAILAGDALLTDAFEVVSTHKFLTDEQKVKLITILSSHSGSNGMVYGQMLDLESERKPIDIDTLKEIHIHKTAKLLQAPMMMASTIVGGEDVNAWEMVGYHLGLAFQIQDDILEVTSTEETMGKSLSDVRNDKSTYVKLLGLEASIEAVNYHFDKIDELIRPLKINHDVIYEVINKVKNRKH